MIENGIGEAKVRVKSEEGGQDCQKLRYSDLLNRRVTRLLFNLSLIFERLKINPSQHQ